MSIQPYRPSVARRARTHFGRMLAGPVGVARWFARGATETTYQEEWHRDEEARLARYVNVRCAMEAIGPLGSIEGLTVYDRRHEYEGEVDVAEAAYELISSRKIPYDNAQYNDEMLTYQTVVTPHGLTSGTSGTCLDFALLYAGYLLGHHLEPLVVILEGHALVALKVTKAPLSVGALGENEQHLRDLVGEGDYVAIEATGMSTGTQNLSFAEACQRGERRVLDEPLKFYIEPGEQQKRRGSRSHPCHRRSWSKLSSLAVAMLALMGGAGWRLWPDVPLPEMPASDGRNLAVFSLDPLGDAQPIDGEILAEELATALRASFNEDGSLSSETNSGWSVWGPSRLKSEIPASTDPEDLAELMRDQNVDIAIYGSIDSVQGRKFPEIRAWFRPTARGVKEAGIGGEVALSIDLAGSNESIARIASELSVQTDTWVSLLKGLGQLHDARLRSELLAARDVLSSAKADVSPTNSTVNGAVSDIDALADLVAGGIHLYVDATYAPEDAGKRANAELAKRALESATTSASPAAAELRARAFLGLAQLEISSHGCQPEGANPTGIADAQSLLQSSAGELAGADLSSEGEIVLRRAVVEGRIGFCAWQAGMAEPDDAIDSLTRAIDDYRSRSEPDARARVRFHVSDAYGLRAQLLADQNPEPALKDLIAAKCLSRPFSEPFWDTKIVDHLDANPALPQEVDCRALN